MKHHKNTANKQKCVWNHIYMVFLNMTTSCKSLHKGTLENRYT